MGLASCLLAPVWTIPPPLPPHVFLRLNVVLFGMPVAIPFLCSPLPLFLDEARRKWVGWVFFLNHHVLNEGERNGLLPQNLRLSVVGM